jgi:hypothetical protein
MAWIAEVASSLASIGSSAYSASQSGGGSGSGRAPSFANVPEPAYERALREYTARLLAQGAASTPPSFLDFVASGGKAKFDLGNTSLTPGEAVALRTVSRGGGTIPWVDPGQARLTPEQIMFAASQGGPGVTPGIKREARQLALLQALMGKEQTPQRQTREKKIKGRLGSEGVEGY